MMLPAVSAAGIIPAYAGNTLDVHWSSPFVRDHPRVCGEHVRDWRGGVRLGGSSPRMRGTRARRGHSGHGIGIIPAYAGNTNVWPFAAFLHRDHPRVCGEHSSSVWAEAPSPGSSPRMRGTLLGFLVGQEHCGIIPAYAGNTVGSGRWPDRCWDHPRVCGEHPPTVCQGVSGLGSSPRMRGTPEENVVVLNNGGIIPAYAGNTLSIFPSNAFKRDHPRVCGEHEVVTNYADAAKGSSPRMRGTQKHPRGTVGAEGIIPAYAGNTR